MDKETLIALRFVLATLYPTIDDSRRIVSDAGIPPMQVAFKDKAVNNWYEILDTAKNRNKILDIVKAALDDGQNDPVLTQVYENGRLLSAVAPVLGQDIPWKGEASSPGLEKLMEGESTLLPISFLELGLERSRSVARVRLQDGGLGTGFLTDNNTFVTNNHVIQDSEKARKAVIQFNYQNRPDGLDLEPVSFNLDPDGGFATSKDDDWTLVRVKDDANATWGKIDLSRVENLQRTRYVNIIQHPSGGPKQIALYHNIVAYSNEKRLQYFTDTLPGSSGSPVFDNHWRVVALHHSGGWIVEPGSKKTVFRNEGININLIVDALGTADIWDG
jgi:V8-like Glu-specific endopeptidase